MRTSMTRHGLDTMPPCSGEGTCPTPDCRRSAWGSAADGYVERNIEQALNVCSGYRHYAFLGPTGPNEVTVPPGPPARAGVTAFQESICFAYHVLGIRDPNCP